MPSTPQYAFPLEPVAPADAAHSRRSEASFVELRDGTVLLAYGRHTGPNDPGYARLRDERIVRYGGGSAIERDNDFGEIVAVRLDSQGRRVTAERVLVPAPADGLNAMSPALRRLPDGRLGMLYSHRESPRLASRRFVSSRDDGETWSEPVVVAEGGYKTGCHDRFSILSDGRLIAPCHGGDDFDSHYRKIWVAWSDDRGETWQTGAAIETPKVSWPDARFMESGCNEPGVAERADRSLLMTMRTAMGTQFGSESFDRGETWTSPRTLEVSSPSAPAHLSRLPDSDGLLLVWTPNYDARAPMNGHRHTLLAGISTDGGRSWPHARRRVLVHDPSRNTDYPAVLFRGNEVWIAVRQSDDPRVIQGRMSTCLVRVPVAWLTGQLAN
ncbi:MAG: exo-alpha-sialidase [Verrucomicrobia bacterium]|nr:exo-alpha-sialidase [Verrucomicrobiota bacterium]